MGLLQSMEPPAHAPISADLTLGINDCRSLEPIRERIASDDQGKWDVTVPRTDLSLRAGKVSIPTVYQQDVPHELRPTTWATSQICQKLGMPSAYFRKCPPHLQDMQFNYWVRAAEEAPYAEEDQRTSSRGEAPERWLLRAKGGVLRGVLSDRYSRLDNAPLVEALSPLLATRFEVRWVALNSESLHLRLIDPQLGREILKDDRLQVGIHIANSEVGCRAVTVDALVYRLVCSNGLIRLVRGKSLLYQRHLYISQERFTVALEVAISEALTTAAGFIEELSQATRTFIPKVETVLADLAVKASLAQTTHERIRIALLNEPPCQQETLYGLVNAVTSAAQALSPDERYELESLAGRLMDRFGSNRNADDQATGRHYTVRRAVSERVAA